MSLESSALQLVPTLEERVIQMRRCDIRHPMIDTLDQRIVRQHKLVQKILTKHGLTVDDLLTLTPEQAEKRDEELQLWYHILRDCAYIDSLR